jgi:hypothetical protein
MPRFNSCCPWCGRGYTSGGAYSTHLSTKDPEKLHARLTISDPKNTQTATTPPPSDVYESFDAFASWSDLYEAIKDFKPVVAPKQTREHDSDDEAPPEGPTSDSCMPSPESSVQTEEFPVNAHAGVPTRMYPFRRMRNPDNNPLHPFLNPRDYKLARYFTRQKVTKAGVDQFFKDDLLEHLGGANPTSAVSFKSGYTLYRKLDFQMDTELPEWITGEVHFRLNKQPTPWYHRDLLACVKHLIR